MVDCGAAGVGTCIAEGDVALELVNMSEAGADIQGISEINRP